MSANRTRPARRSRSAGDDSLRDLRNCAWRVFRLANLGYREIILSGETYEVYQKALGVVEQLGYGCKTLARIAEASRPPVSVSHFQDWIGQAVNGRQAFANVAVYGIILELKQMLGYGPQFGPFGNWIFLGRFRRNVSELPLSAIQQGLPSEDDQWVDLWGHPNGSAVCIRAKYMDDRVFEPADTLDSHAREAFRRLALEVVPAV